MCACVRVCVCVRVSEKGERNRREAKMKSAKAGARKKGTNEEDKRNTEE